MNNISLLSTIAAKRALIFDLFHTLTRTDPSWGTYKVLGVSRETWNEQLLEKSPDRLTGKETDPLTIIQSLSHAIDPSIPHRVIEHATENRIEKFAQALIEIPTETVRFFEQLKKAGKKIGLLSNADVMECAAWYQSPIAPFFDSVLFSCRAGYAKPERQIYEMSLHDLQVQPEDSVFIGDGGSGELEGAQAVGMTTVMMTGIIKDLWPDRIEQRKPYADFVIENLSELIEDRP